MYVSLKNINDRIFNIKNEDEFQRVSLEVFNYQIKNNDLYRKFSSLTLKNKKPKKAEEIPFLPIDFFKTNEIKTSNKTVEKIFKSSGTSGLRSKHYVQNLDIYKKSFITNFKENYGPIKDLCILALLPSYIENGNSSLIFMIEELIILSENKDSGFYNSNFLKISNTIKNREAKNQKTILIGVTYSLLDFAKDYKQNLNHTTIIETGGMKGKRKELLKEEIHNILKSSFDVKNIHSEYGMTELLSQAYSKKDGIFTTPNWMKVLVRDINDPITLLANNQTGGVNIIDLANINSCSFIATQDIGIKLGENKFKITGRFSNADVRGCNLLIQ